MPDDGQQLATGLPSSTVKVVATYDAAPPGPLKLPFISSPYVDLAAGFRSLRHRMSTQTDARIVAVTSPEPEEGKTTCALNLAMAFAEHGTTQVLLVEANLQHPSIAAGLGFTPPMCFASQMRVALEAGASYTWQAVATYFPNLHVLAIDPTQAKTGYLDGAQFSHAMRQISATRYEHIIIDCPPVFGSADLSIIQDCADGILFAAHAGVSKASELRSAVQQLEPANILGTVLMAR